MIIKKKYEELNSVKIFKEFLRQFHSYYVRNFNYEHLMGSSPDRMSLKVLLKELDDDFFDCLLDEIPLKISELKENYPITFGSISLERDTHFHCGDYEGSSLYLIHSFTETDEIYKERMRLLSLIEEEIIEIENKEKLKKEKKEKDLFKELSKKFNKTK